MEDIEKILRQEEINRLKKENEEVTFFITEFKKELSTQNYQGQLPSQITATSPEINVVAQAIARAGKTTMNTYHFVVKKALAHAIADELGVFEWSLDTLFEYKTTIDGETKKVKKHIRSDHEKEGLFHFIQRGEETNKYSLIKKRAGVWGNFTPEVTERIRKGYVQHIIKEPPKKITAPNHTTTKKEEQTTPLQKQPIVKYQSAPIVEEEITDTYNIKSFIEHYQLNEKHISNTIIEGDEISYIRKILEHKGIPEDQSRTIARFMRRKPTFSELFEEKGTYVEEKINAFAEKYDSKTLQEITDTFGEL